MWRITTFTSSQRMESIAFIDTMRYTTPHSIDPLRSMKTMGGNVLILGEYKPSISIPIMYSDKIQKPPTVLTMQ